MLAIAAGCMAASMAGAYAATGSPADTDKAGRMGPGTSGGQMGATDPTPGKAGGTSKGGSAGAMGAGSGGSTGASSGAGGSSAASTGGGSGAAASSGTGDNTGKSSRRSRRARASKG